MRKKHFLKNQKTPLLFAHRGYSARAPENTLRAFKLASDEGIPGLELDIHLLPGGELAVFHDDNLKRICGIDKNVEDCTLEELKSLDAGIWKGEEFRNEQIPLLGELFELLGTKVYYDIEIKSRSTKPGPLEETLRDLIFRRGLENHCLVSSFNPIRIRDFKKICPEIPTAIIYASDPEVPWFLRKGAGRLISSCDILKPEHSQTGRALARRKISGYQVFSWTVDDPVLAEELLRRGVDGLISNDPGPLKTIIENLEKSDRGFQGAL